MPVSKPDIRFAVAITESAYGGGSRYVHFTAQAMIAAIGRFGSDEGKPGLFSPASYELPFDPDVKALAGLEISAQADENTMRKTGQEFYGWSVAYQRRSVELADAEAMVRVLRKIGRGMTRLSGELGRPVTLAQFATHAVRALTAERAPFTRHVEDNHDFGGTGYRSMDPAALDHYIWSECAAWRERYGVQVT
jgi:hypothetical protein